RSYNVIATVGGILFEFALDTGSSDLWLVSDGCDTQQCKGTPAYPLKTYASPTFQSVNDNTTVFHISFADFTAASGFVARETVRVGSIESAGQALAMISSSNLTLGQSVSGILGLGFPHISRIASTVPNAEPFLTTLVQSGQLAYPLFGLSLTRNTSGTLSLGAIDRTVVQNVSSISWHDVTPFAPLPNENVTTSSLYLHWAIPLNNLVANITAINLQPTYPAVTGTSPLALFDVGYTGISGPIKDVAAIFNALGTLRQVSPGVWGIPCDTQSTITFTFAGTNVTLQPSDYIIGPTQGDPNLCLSWPVGVPPSSDGLDWHLGTPFLRTVYTVFSHGIAGLEPPLIGLYPLSNTTEYTDTPAGLSSLFSSLSATIATTAPPVLLPTPTFSTLPYIFNTSITPLPTVGQVLPTQVSAGNSTYSPLFTQAVGTSHGLALLRNASALPALDAPSTIATLTMTDSLGVVHITTSTASTIPTAALGQPPGSFNFNAGLAVVCPQLVWLLLSSFLVWAWSK
ncbi:acid protease, partial [Hysterangium stoloniferum]